MGDDLAGMGAGSLDFDEEQMMMRQPTVNIKDPEPQVVAAPEVVIDVVAPVLVPVIAPVVA